MATREEVEQRRQAALTLRLQGGSYRLIAETLVEEQLAPAGYDERRAYADVKHMLDRQRGQTMEVAHEMREINLLRIDEMIASLFEYARKGDAVAIDRILKLMDHQAKLAPIHVPPPKQTQEVLVPSSDGAQGFRGLQMREVIIQLNTEPPTMPSLNGEDEDDEGDEDDAEEAED